MFLGRLNSVFFFISGFSGVFSFYSSFLFTFILLMFLSFRVPYLFGLFGFVLFLIWWILPLYLSFFFSRLENFGLSCFLGSFIPEGCPIWISPLVALAETMSYLVRPVVLLMRPFLNISIGVMGGMVLCSLCFVSSGFIVLLGFLFIYEVFVALVHWFIVCNILCFSEEH